MLNQFSSNGSAFLLGQTMLLNYSVEVNVWKSFLGIGGWELAVG